MRKQTKPLFFIGFVGHLGVAVLYHRLNELTVHDLDLETNIIAHADGKQQCGRPSYDFKLECFFSTVRATLVIRYLYVLQQQLALGL